MYTACQEAEVLAGPGAEDPPAGPGQCREDDHTQDTSQVGALYCSAVFFINCYGKIKCTRFVRKYFCCSKINFLQDVAN